MVDDTDLKYFEDAMNNSLEWGDRYNGILKLNDMELITKIVKMSLDSDIRNVAVRKLDDQDLLVEVVLTDPDSNVREAALESLANWQRDTFKKVAKDDSSWILRRYAVERLPGIFDDYFADLLINEEDFRVRRAIMRKMKMVKLSHDKLYVLTLYAQDGEVRAAAARMINDEKQLANIAIQVGDYVIAEEAIERINNKEFIKEIATKADFAHTRMKAVQKIDDDIFLSNLVKSDKNLVVRGSAVYQIRSLETLEAMKMLNDLELIEDVNARIAQLEAS